MDENTAIVLIVAIMFGTLAYTIWLTIGRKQ